MRQDLSWTVLPLGVFDTAKSIEMTIKQMEEDGYELKFLNDKWMFFGKGK